MMTIIIIILTITIIIIIIIIIIILIHTSGSSRETSPGAHSVPVECSLSPKCKGRRCLLQLEMLRRHGCYRNGGTGVGREGRGEAYTSTTPVPSSPASQFWNGGSGSSPTRGEVERNGRVIRNEYTQI